MPDPYSQLLEWRRNEGSARGLAKLPRDFYATTAAYLQETRRAYEGDLRENPSSRRGELARQTHQRASQIGRDIVEARMSKLLSAAFQASIGGVRDLPNALPEERSLFDRLVQNLIDYRRASAPYLESDGAAAPLPGAPVPSATKPAAPPGTSDGPVSPASRMEYVRILKDSRPIQIGPDTVDLRREEILAVPPETAQLLVATKLAERVRTESTPPVT